MLPKAETLADGHWPEILMHAGVDSTYFKATNGPCPFCGGKDRYRWSNKNGGLYICGQCTEAKYKSGFDFLARHKGFSSFQQSANYVRGYFGINGSLSDDDVVRRLAQTPTHSVRVDPQKSLERMHRQWSETLAVTPNDPVHAYLTKRVVGLRHVPDEIRYHPALDYWNPPEALGGRPTLLGKFPAMLVRGFNEIGELVQMHKTYLDAFGHKADVPNPKKTDQGVGCNSFAFRMGHPADVLGVSEGIETGLAASLMRGVPVWPCHSTSILANFVLPPDLVSVVKKLYIFADSDEVKNGKKPGEEAAKTLAERVKKLGLKSIIIRPVRSGTDFADRCYMV